MRVGLSYGAKPRMMTNDGRTPDLMARLRRRLPSKNERRVTYALKVLATVAVSIYLIVGVLNFFAAIRTTGILVIGAVFFAYLLYPLIRRLNAQLPLIWAIVVVYGFVALIFAFTILLVAPALSSDVTNAVKSFPGLILRVQHELASPSLPLLRRIPLDDRLYLANLPAQFGAAVQTQGVDALTRGFNVLLSAVSVVGALVIVPVLSAYLLLDVENVRRQLLGLFPARRRAGIDSLIDDLDGVMGGFIRGQLIDGAIVGVMIFIMLTAMHVPYALLIGVAAGLLNFIPYAGAVAGFIPSVILAFAYNGITNALIVAGLFAVIQQIDGNFVAPRVLKDAVGLSPLYIIISILVGSELFGLPGTFLAVPVAAMIKVLREHLLPPAVSRAEAPPELTAAPHGPTA